jgi:major membrane immunogen (membrane-anchored lipoprotein)
MSPRNQKSVAPRRSTRCLALLAIPALLILASCGGTDDGLGKRYPVSGTVKYNGSPLEKGEISFVTEDMSKNFGATGTITNGSYTLSMGGDSDGAQAGKYKVTIIAKEDYMEKAQADFKKETGSTSPKVLGNFLAKAAAAAKSLIPAGYGDARTTTLKAEVEAKSNTFNFDLSDAEAPPEPPKTPVKGNASGRKVR